MKRIVNGVTYNTSTSTRLAQARWEGDGGNVVGILYQTRGGAFFVDEETTRTVRDAAERPDEERIEHGFVPLSPDGAHKWILEGDVEIFNNPFDDPPEATAEAEPGATIYVRVPSALKSQVEGAAKRAQMSSNAWILLCMERCLNAENGGSYGPQRRKVGSEGKVKEAKVYRPSIRSATLLDHFRKK
jgi:hypothetical protein